MNFKETATLLAKIHVYDNRKVDEPTVRAWHEALGDLPLDECLEAVANYYRESTRWIMPANVRQATPSGKKFDPANWMNQ